MNNPAMNINKIVPPTTPPIITATLDESDLPLGKLPTYTQTAHNHHMIIYNYVYIYIYIYIYIIYILCMYVCMYMHVALSFGYIWC